MTRRITVRSGSVPRKVSPPASLASAAGADSDAIHDNVDGEISAIAAKGSPTDADFLLIEDGAASNAKKRITIGDLPTLTDPIEMAEISAPSAPSADMARLYIEDNGSGKTRLMVLFATGVAQQIAIEP